MPSFDKRNSETCTAPTNIAVIKYWGKDNVKLNTPMNSSLSVTLDQEDLHTITTVAASKNFESNKLWLNNKPAEITNRINACLREILKLAQDRVDPTTGEVLIKKEDWPQYKVYISSVNTFPTGAGLASSAAGLACLVAALAKLYCAKEEYPGQLTAIARQGSGSASRSLYGGFVKWQKGSLPDGSDSIAVQVADHTHWEDMRAIVLVVSDKEKDTSSTSGMETSKATSPFLKYRAECIVDGRMTTMEDAIRNRDFQTFGQLTMQDSNQFHSTCLDTYPPIFYMNDVSKTIIRLVHVINAHFGCVKAAYTFDAGPNAVIYTLKQDAPMVLAVMSKYFPAPGATRDYCNSVPAYAEAIGQQASLPASLVQDLDRTGRIPTAGDVKYIFVTRPGPGPQSTSESLLDPATGEPVPAGPRHQQMKIVAASPTKDCKKCCLFSGCPFTCAVKLTGIALIAGVATMVAMKCARK